MTITRIPEATTTDGDIEVLLREAKRRSRLRRSAIVAAVLAAVTALVLVLTGVSSARPSHGSTHASPLKAVPIAPGTIRPVGFPSSGANVGFYNVSCASGSACIVVGRISRRSYAVGPQKPADASNAAWRYKLGTWHRIASPLWTNLDGPGPLSCPTASFCVMASNHLASTRGAQLHASVQVLANGRWTEERTPSPSRWSHTRLQAVDCVSTGWCMAVGRGSRLPDSFISYSDVYHNGRWTLLPIPPAPAQVEPGFPTEDVNAVSCTSPTFCLAVGDAPGSNASIATADSYNGQSWTPVAVPRLQASELGRPTLGVGNKALPWNQSLTGVACATPTDCAITGEFYNDGDINSIGGSFVMHFDGTTMSEQLLFAKGPNDGHQDGALSGIACTSKSRCASYVLPFGYNPEIAERFDAVQLDHVGWYTSSRTYVKGQFAMPSDISCLSNGRCLIVGAIEQSVPVSPTYPEGRTSPLVLAATARPL